MDSDFLPNLEDAKNSQFGYLQKLSKSSNAFYNFLLLTIIFGFLSLPFISIDITASSPITIQTRDLQETLYSPLSGQISTLKIQNNRPVLKGDTVFTILNAQVKHEIALNNDRRAVVEHSLQDLAALQSNLFKSSAVTFHTAQYQSQYTHYLEQRALLTARLENATKTFQRSTTLYRQKVIPASEQEKCELEHQQALSDVKILETNTRSQWQTDRFALHQELDNLKVKESQLRELVSKSTVLANTSGTGYNSEGIRAGSFVQGGQKIAEIIPNTNLVAICLVSPKDIGFIKERQRVRLQIDAYNYYDWGTLNGTVSEIRKDVSIVDNKPFYVVHCSMDKTFLTLKSGYKGSLLKGMTGRANFNLTTATLWQLLFTNLNDWLNPKQN